MKNETDDDDLFRILSEDLQFAILLPPNHYLNTIRRTYDKKTITSALTRRWVGDNRDIALQFLYEILRRAREVLNSDNYSQEEKELIKNKLAALTTAVKNLHDFYGEENPDIRSKLITFRDKLYISLAEINRKDPRL